MSALTVSGLLASFRSGDRRACARLISVVEDEAEGTTEILNELYPLMGRAYRIGITGPPGAGKSTLVEKLAQECRNRGRTVGIVAVDPTSPFSGGAVLGDRIRMPTLFTDPGVFIRSMATRGGMGGLATRTKEVCDVLDAFGRDYILVETVGVGQVELDIAQAAHSTLVVLVPESGDSIQVMKAGFMEIGDVFCVNKCDRQGADRLVLAIQAMLELRQGQLGTQFGPDLGHDPNSGDGIGSCPRPGGWMPPVVKTSATDGTGTGEVLARLDEHRKYLGDSNLLVARRKSSIQAEIRELVEARLKREVWTRQDIADMLSRLVEKVFAGGSTPYRAAREILELVQPDDPKEA